MHFPSLSQVNDSNYAIMLTDDDGFPLPFINCQPTHRKTLRGICSRFDDFHQTLVHQGWKQWRISWDTSKPGVVRFEYRHERYPGRSSFIVVRDDLWEGADRPPPMFNYGNKNREK